MAEKRARKAAEEAKENKANELLRRKAGQVSAISIRTTGLAFDNCLPVFQDQTAAKEELKAKQMKKEQEAKARGMFATPHSRD